MKPLLFASNQAYSGKSSFCVGIGMLLKEKGYKVGYMKPIITLPFSVEGQVADEDAKYISKLFDIHDDISDISPVNYIELLRTVSPKNLEKHPENFLDKIGKSFEKLSTGKDILLIEGARTIEDGMHLGISAREICRKLGAKVIVIVRYADEMLDKVLYYSEFFRDALAGIIINLVPGDCVNRLKSEVFPYLEKNKIKIFGYVTSDNILSSVSVKDISAHLEAKILSAEEKQGELVEAFMLGAMGHDLALSYFKTKTEKAVITGGDRADIQLAALETGTKCLILTGNFSPSSIVVSRAQELGVPILLVKYDSITTIEKLNEILGHTGFHEFKKIDKIVQITRDFIDLEAIISSVR
jgi:BioD-like phosphotransacetylase family protein